MDLALGVIGSILEPQTLLSLTIGVVVGVIGGAVPGITITMMMPAETPSRKLQPSKRIRLPQDCRLLPAQRACRLTSCSTHRLLTIASQ